MPAADARQMTDANEGNPPNDWPSLTAPAPGPATARPLWSPPVLLSLVATMPGLLLAIEGASRRSLGTLIVPFFISAFVSVTWLLFLLVALWTARLRMPLRAWILWLVIPGILALTAVTTTSDVPFGIRFALGRTAMDQAAADVIAGGSTERTSIGLFPVEDVERISNGVRFAIAGAGFIGERGLAFSPEGPPVDVDRGLEFQPLGGGWWTWAEEFD